MSTRLNNAYNMKLIRKAMIDLDLNSLNDLAKYLYMSETALRCKLNGRTSITKRDLEYIEYKLKIKFNWDEIFHVKDNEYNFYNSNFYIAKCEVS